MLIIMDYRWGFQWASHCSAVSTEHFMQSKVLSHRIRWTLVNSVRYGYDTAWYGAMRRRFRRRTVPLSSAVHHRAVP